MKCRNCNKTVMVNPQFILKNLKIREFKCIKCNENSEEKIENSPNCDLPIKIVKVQTLKSNEAVQKRSNGKKKMNVKCYVCGLEVGSNIKLFWHMKNHLEHKQFKCPVCRDDFSTREDMIDHCKAVHSKSNKVRCDICEKEFYNVDLTTHMKTHQGSSIRIESEPKKAVEIVNLRNSVKQQSENEMKIEKTVTQNGSGGSTYVRCKECKIFVFHKELYQHKLKHSEEKTSILVKNIFKGKK
ncbi:hypothetical protein PVAND_016446 [Polypedilum vanderplanki]|uniref:C2H2-type domain-containing protein n=1 Tax=Polypedilum vanderplanki TaxID=319348 RepID=A0A9J6BG83_POLVA|nr:hypothetical protein PVAND_016446 [Polypedilum vanderplanki]